MTDLLRIAASFGVAFLADPGTVQRVMAGMEQGERCRLIQAGAIRFADHARRAADGAGNHVPAHAHQHDNGS